MPDTPSRLQLCQKGVGCGSWVDRHEEVRLEVEHRRREAVQPVLARLAASRSLAALGQRPEEVLPRLVQEVVPL